MNTIAKTIRIDSKLLEEVTPILDGLGLSLSDALNIFLRQVVLHRGIPFMIEFPRDMDPFAKKKVKRKTKGIKTSSRP